MRKAELSDLNCLEKAHKYASREGHFLDLDLINNRSGLTKELIRFQLESGQVPNKPLLRSDYYVFEVGRCFVGYVCIRDIDSIMTRAGFPADCVELHQMVILPEHQRKGHGRALLNAVTVSHPKDIFARAFQKSLNFLRLSNQIGFQLLGIACNSSSEHVLFLDRSGCASKIQSNLQKTGMVA